MIDEFHVMYMYKKIQVEAATTDIKTLEQLLKMKRLQRMLEKMACDRVSPEDLKE